MALRSNSQKTLGARVGVLGGGQLARMLCLKGHEMGLTMKVLCRSASEPAAQVTAHVVLGDPDNEQDVAAFARTVDVFTLESEFHAGEMLDRAARTSGTPCFPHPKLIGRLQDRLPQKELLLASRVPTAPFIAVSSSADLEEAHERFDGRFVLKKRQGGYDGYGTFMVRTANDFKELRNRIDPGKTPCIAEALVPFKRELAVQLARNANGRTAIFPVVETHQVDHRLDWLRGPIRHGGFSTFARRLVNFVDAVDYVGVIAFELFDTGRELLVNEIAPRVHNSGHASLEALSVDQFTQHLRAILNLDLSPPAPLTRGFAMINLIGDGADEPKMPSKFSGHLHWYGKNESRRGRKMGHLTAVGTSADACLRALTRERKGFKL